MPEVHPSPASRSEGPGRNKPISKQYTYGVWEFGEFSEARAE